MASSLISFIKRKTSLQFKFNEQFEQGKWDGLHDVGELARYSIIAGYINFYTSSPAVLDLGCGEGILQKRIGRHNYSAYLGVDFSEVAIAKATAAADDATRFMVADISKLEPESKYDVIVYNESIYYVNDIQLSIESMLPHLNDEGIIVISIVDKHGKVQKDLWKIIAEVIIPVDTTQVINRKGDSWTIQAYKKKPV